MSLNKVMLIGNVGNDPEVRYLNDSQTKVARLRIATTERFTDRNGEVRENTEWHTVSAWRRLAETVEKVVRKGSQLYVEGRLQTREWTDQSGAKRFSTEIVADSLQLLGKRTDAPAAGAPYNQSGTPTTVAGPGGYQAPYQPNTPAAPGSFSNAAKPVAAAPEFGAPADGEDDLPF